MAPEYPYHSLMTIHQVTKFMACKLSTDGIIAENHVFEKH